MHSWTGHIDHYVIKIRSVEASPEIPFSPARRPRTQGLLKNKVGDPSIVERPPEEICKGQVVAKNTIKNSKSKAAQVRKT